MSKSIIVYFCVLFVTTSGQTYNCVPAGTCPSASNTGTPDIRIITGGSMLCPPGQVPCVPTSTTFACGARSVSSSDADGNTVPGSFPWQVYMVNQTNMYFGSGVILDQYNILTAAHKVQNNIFVPSNIKVYAGVWDPRSMATASNRTVVRMTIHPSFNPNTLFNDLAIIRVDTPFLLGVDPTVGCAALPPQGASFIGRRCMVSGWGQSDANPAFSITGPQRQVNVPIVDYATCRSAHSSANSLGGNVDMYLDPIGEICAGGESQKDACTNDGGAPLVCMDSTTGRWNAVGLVIWGKGCGTQGLHGVYANIANYRTWIDSTLATLNSG